ncbi:hypothetical protein PV726_40210 [Streptomyces europaeiscabiei]|uniref:hypothetical protein n=1 Tax=Streptomyces europaeiscabiei TaxID=146819 RepID=UPI0029B0F201|nr:hypothetical protein [Streptomyces europaeiscabiei]MDX3696419.1 hypothetical protein [Streptomyces europaeiscabiei]
MFAARRLIAPWALCPSTTEADVVREWLTWASVGMEGVVFKRLDGAYRPSVRGWEKYKVRETSEAIVGAVTGSLAVPRTLLLGRYDAEGRFQYVGRTTILAQAAGAAVAGLLAAGRRGHPWTDWSFSARWGSQEKLSVTLVAPELVVEVGVDVARDASGRWRHPARRHRARPDLSPADVPRLTSHRTDAARARRPRRRATSVSAPDPRLRPRRPSRPPSSSTPARAWSKRSQRGCQQPDHAKTTYQPAQMREGIYRYRNT